MAVAQALPAQTPLDCSQNDFHGFHLSLSSILERIQLLSCINLGGLLQTFHWLNMQGNCLCARHCVDVLGTRPSQVGDPENHSAMHQQLYHVICRGWEKAGPLNEGASQAAARECQSLSDIQPPLRQVGNPGVGEVLHT